MSYDRTYKQTNTQTVSPVVPLTTTFIHGGHGLL